MEVYLSKERERWERGRFHKAGTDRGYYLAICVAIVTFPVCSTCRYVPTVIVWSLVGICRCLRRLNACSWAEYRFSIPYSRKYWRELYLVVEPKIIIARILADLNLVVRYGITIRIYASRIFWQILIW